MANIDKVIKGLECCLKELKGFHNNPCKECPYLDVDSGIGGGCIDRTQMDSLELLKELKEENKKLGECLTDSCERVRRLREQITMMNMVYGAQGKVIGELVRCKDCKHFEPDGIYTMCYRHNGLSQGEDWFCPDGERR